MAGARPFFSPHEAFARASTASSPAAAATVAVAAPAPDPSPATGHADAAEVAVFRLLLPQAFSDADAMRLYAAIAPLRRLFPTLQVRVETLGVGASSDDADGDGDGGGGGGGGRVAVVLGPASPARRVEASSSSGEPLELSPAQEALVALLDSGWVVHLNGEAWGAERMTCLVLVEAGRLEAASGKGILWTIANESGAEVRVTPWGGEGGAAYAAQPPEEVVEITGDGTTVRRALVSVSSCLQDMSTERANTSIPHIDCPQGATGIEQTECVMQFSFRLLCPVTLAGGLIGKNGMVIKAIEVNSGASVDVGGPVHRCMERAITVSALEKPGQKFSMVENAVLRIFDRMQVVESNMHSRPSNPLHCSARVLILKGQFGYLVGPGGSLIKHMNNTTRTKMKILEETAVPACASQYELVLQITGEPMNVRDALSLVCEKLRNHCFSSEKTTYGNGHVPSSAIDELTTSSQVNISSTGQYSAGNLSRVDHRLSQNEIDSVQNSISAFDLGRLGSPQIQKPTIGCGTEINNPINEVEKPANGNGTGINNLNTEMQNENGIDVSNHGATSLEEKKLLRGIKTATITRITYEVAVCGDNGNDFTMIREMSGADVTAHYPLPETSDGMIVISGTPDEAQSALAMFLDLVKEGQ
ncbi:KH domain-containing protein HEN4-like isoform X3 [Oryza glaberrima]|uniref:KH domain-containing protein HEN4-like isoform X3 n=1 Tax=Oryza glaberrima TaxID=4538 RepID=UPI00224C0442|nr:KH domain-containing protein HEN4-like isoform X3 [Oryza glaberrima]